MARKPNMGLAMVLGQVRSSASSSVDHWSISSEMGWSLERVGRETFCFGDFDFTRMAWVRDRLLQKRPCVESLGAGQGARLERRPPQGHGRGAAGGKMEMRLGEGLHLVEGGVGGEFAEDEALRRDVDESEFGDDVIHDFDASEREGALFEDFGFVV